MSIMDRILDAGSMDKAFVRKYGGQMKKCSKGHLNSPNAKKCWKCGEELVKV